MYNVKKELLKGFVQDKHPDICTLHWTLGLKCTTCPYVYRDENEQQNIDCMGNYWEILK